jgi:hypothetical protein
VTGQPGLPPRRRADVAFAAAACIVLAGYNNVAGARPWHRRWYPAVNALAAAATLGAAAASGLTAADLGLRRDQLRSGLSLGSAAAAPVVAAFGLAALTPATRPLLNDQRIAGLDRRQYCCTWPPTARGRWPARRRAPAPAARTDPAPARTRARTVSVPDDVYRNARVAAAQRDTSVSALVVAYLEQLSGRMDEYARLEALQREVQAGIGQFRAADRLSRDEAHDRAVR